MGFRRAFQQGEEILFYIRSRISLSKQERQLRIEFFGLSADESWQVRPDRPGNVEYRLIHLNPSLVGTYPAFSTLQRTAWRAFTAGRAVSYAGGWH